MKRLSSLAARWKRGRSYSALEPNLPRNAANFQPLTPCSFLERSATIWPEREAYVHYMNGSRVSRTYRELQQRVFKLSSALKKLNLVKNESVSILATNTPAMIEAHYAVPMARGILNPINVRLSASQVRTILLHAESRILLVDREYSTIVLEALQTIPKDKWPLLIDIDEGGIGESIGYTNYEDFITSGDEVNDWCVDDEWDTISLNYTSGTTGEPKGVCLHHRGAYLTAVGNVLAFSCQFSHHPKYLWTLPMFHCNGWCYPYTNVLLGATQVCLRAVRSDVIYDLLDKEKVTHMCGAPVVMQILLRDMHLKRHQHRVQMMTAASPPPAKVLASMEENGFDLTHVYGLTEVYGPAVVCVPQDDWKSLELEEKAKRMSRQGVRYSVLENLKVMDPVTMEPVPADGKTIGEIMFKGNVVMSGYLKNPKATAEAFKGGWYRSGDLAVLHPDGYCQIRDRSKDIIISGGENISSVEIENVLCNHPKVEAAAVVARPDKQWGETPCAFIQMKPDQEISLTEDEIIRFVQESLPRFMVPKTVIFTELPTTNTGKVQKHTLRDIAKKIG